jgi:hypothetical protein
MDYEGRKMVVWFSRLNLRNNVPSSGHQEGGLRSASQEAHCEGR